MDICSSGRCRTVPRNEPETAMSLGFIGASCTSVTGPDAGNGSSFDGPACAFVSVWFPAVSVRIPRAGADAWQSDTQAPVADWYPIVNTGTDSLRQIFRAVPRLWHRA